MRDEKNTLYGYVPMPCKLCSHYDYGFPTYCKSTKIERLETACQNAMDNWLFARGVPHMPDICRFFNAKGQLVFASKITPVSSDETRQLTLF